MTVEYPVGPKSRKEVVLFVGEVYGNVNLREGEIEECRWIPLHDLQNYLLSNVAAIVEKAIMHM